MFDKKAYSQAYHKKYAQDNRARINKRKRAWYVANREKLRAANNKWKAENTAKIQAANAAYYAANTEKVHVANNKWRAANPERVKATGAAWRIANRERKKAQNRAWRLANPARDTATLARRRARKLAQTCGCCAPWSFKFIYAQGRALGMHVDHVKPLAKGGLHCLKNMQLLSPLDNQRKSARYVEAQPEVR
jgi:HNH endonuclease